METVVAMKICSKCKVEKTFNGFHKKKAAKDGHQPVCKSCMKLWQQSNEGMASARKASNKFANSKKGKHYAAKYRKTNFRKISVSNYDNSEKGKIAKKKSRKAALERKYWTNRYKTDIDFRLRCALRSRMKAAIKKGFKSGSAVEDLGCSITDFNKYLESLWQPGMNWDNWGKGRPGKWNIDHIIPLSSFDLKDPEQYKKAAHFTNQQPLWAIDNLKKGDR